MTGYMKDARRHSEEIRHYHEYAGSKGYDQAIYHFEQLTGLIFKAMNSKKYKREAPIINSFKKDMQPLMDEMKKRKIAQDN